jgi:hypothetical protein
MSFSDLPLGPKAFDTGEVMALPHLNAKLLSRLFAATVLLLLPTTAVSAVSETDAGKLTCQPCHLRFSRVNVGQTKTLSSTLTNTGTKSITVTKMNDNAPGYDVSNLSLPLTLTAGQSTTFDVTFMPTDNGRIPGNIELISNGPGSDLIIYLYGQGVMDGALTANPWGIDFGSLGVGHTQTRTESLTNSGTSSVTISQAIITGTGFGMTGINPPITLTAGQTFTFNVSFKPVVNGYAVGAISVVSDAPNPALTISLSGTGLSAGELAVSPATMNFGDVFVGTTEGLTGTLSATIASVTVSSVSSSNSEFTLSGLSFPFTIAAGKSVPFSVTFKPADNGNATSSISFVSDASNSPTTVAARGHGTPLPQHSVALSWDASGDSNVVGYNVYRSNNFGGPYTQINSELDPLTNYTDGTVQGGQTYFYAATALDTDGLESKPSNIAKAVIPFP